MQLGGFFIWTYTYHLIRTDGVNYHRNKLPIEAPRKIPNGEMDAGLKGKLLITDQEKPDEQNGSQEVNESHQSEEL